jgi:hypothetical protein
MRYHIIGGETKRLKIAFLIKIAACTSVWYNKTVIPNFNLR